MPQMSPLLWSMIIILTISLLLTISSFMYFMHMPSPECISPTYTPLFKDLTLYNWTW